MNDERKQRRARASKSIGWIVFGGLGTLTLFEYAVAITVGFNVFFLVQIAAVKAGLIAWYFMHIARSWSGAEEEH